MPRTRSGRRLATAVTRSRASGVAAGQRQRRRAPAPARPARRCGRRRVASANSLAMHRRQRVAGAKSEAWISGELPITIVTAIVSPSARPRPRIAAPRMPGPAYGSTAMRIASQRVAPSASAPSRSAAGMVRSTSMRDRGDGRQDHDRQDDARGEKAEADRRALEERQEAERACRAPAPPSRAATAPARTGPTGRRPRWGWPPASRPEGRTGGQRGGAISVRKSARPIATGTASTMATSARDQRAVDEGQRAERSCDRIPVALGRGSARGRAHLASGRATQRQVQDDEPGHHQDRRCPEHRQDDRRTAGRPGCAPWLTGVRSAGAVAGEAGSVERLPHRLGTEHRLALDGERSRPSAAPSPPPASGSGA